MPPLVWTDNCCIVSISILLYISINQDIFITKKQNKTAWQGRDVETEHEKKKDVWSENFNLRRDTLPPTPPLNISRATD